uniref:Uncharacterized protein n=1 Tax=Opuntia streptacantha TaxID=393608 RepID=A0A7C9AF69_OPUST
MTEPQSLKPCLVSFNRLLISNPPRSSFVISDTLLSIARHSSRTKTASSSGSISTANSFQFSRAVAFPFGLSSENLTRVTNPSSSSASCSILRNFFSSSLTWYCIFRPLSSFTCKKCISISDLIITTMFTFKATA